LGLPAGADIDALAIGTGGGPFGGPGTIEYSLTAATAGLVGVSPADILGLGAGPPVVVVHPFFSIGLLGGDDLDALDVSAPIPEPTSLGVLATGLTMLSLRRRR
jgi:hypothetical protein